MARVRRFARRSFRSTRKPVSISRTCFTASMLDGGSDEVTELVLLAGANWQAAGLEDNVLQHVTVKRIRLNFAVAGLWLTTAATRFSAPFFWFVYKVDADEPPPVGTAILAGGFINQERILDFGVRNLTWSNSGASDVPFSIWDESRQVDIRSMVKMRQDELLIFGIVNPVDLTGAIQQLNVDLTSSVVYSTRT